MIAVEGVGQAVALMPSRILERAHLAVAHVRTCAWTSIMPPATMTSASPLAIQAEGTERRPEPQSWLLEALRGLPGMPAGQRGGPGAGFWATVGGEDLPRWTRRRRCRLERARAPP